MASDFNMTRSLSESEETKDNIRVPQINFHHETLPVIVKPSFCMDESQRREMSFQERKTEVDGAIEWIRKEIKSLKQEDQNLMRQFVNLRSILNSLKNRPTLDRKTSLPENSPTSPLSPLYHIPEDSPETFYARDGSPGLRRRAQSAFAGVSSPAYPLSPLSLDGSDFGEDDEKIIF